MTPLLRRATADDLRAIADVDARAFGSHQSDSDLEAFRPLFEPDRFLLACDPDSGAIVGATGSYPLEVTLPGGAVLPAPGVTWVSVDPTMRRRGILRAMFTEQHTGFVADGLALSLLTASEGAIYGRFGYGVTTRDRSFEILRRRAVFRADVPDPGGVSYVDNEAARKHAPEVHRRWCARTPGAVARSDAMWNRWLQDDERWRGGGSALFYLAHPDGYVSYRINHSDDAASVADFFAATDEASIALWRVLFGLDLVEKITGWKSLAMDDPLPLLLTDPRRVRTTDVNDGMWSRVLDVPAALAARTYAAEIDVVLDVHDDFLDRGGRVRLRGGPEGATCEPTDALADVELAVAALGPLLFGAGRATTYARAGLASAAPAVLGRMDAAFATDRDPLHGTGF